MTVSGFVYDPERHYGTEDLEELPLSTLGPERA